MLIVSVESSKVKWINNLNNATEIPFIGSIFVACCFMFPTFFIQYFVELLFGKIPVYDLSFTFFLNTFCIHLFLRIVFDIKIKFFFISSLFICILCMILNFSNEKEQLIQMLSLF
jgi:hypothetical protein